MPCISWQQIAHWNQPRSSNNIHGNRKSLLLGSSLNFFSPNIFYLVSFSFLFLTIVRESKITLFQLLTLLVLGRTVICMSILSLVIQKGSPSPCAHFRTLTQHVHVKFDTIYPMIQHEGAGGEAGAATFLVPSVRYTKPSLHRRCTILHAPHGPR